MILNLYLEHKNYFDIIANNKIIYFFIPGIKYLLFLWFAFNLINWNNKRKVKKNLPLITSNFVKLVKKFRSENNDENRKFLYNEIKSMTPKSYKDLLNEIKLPQNKLKGPGLERVLIHTERMNAIYEIAKHLGCLDEIKTSNSN